MRTNVLYYITGFSVVIVFLFVVGVLAFHEVPEHNRELFIHLMGIIEGAFVGGLVSTFFGSSKRDHEPGVTTETETKTESIQP